ncbi:MAG: mechanosensitive ion channel family protein [Actinomycetota bacterium]|nr:mechanosensitive ion channel family protein [Actinomycetota bacterium]
MFAVLAAQTTTTTEGVEVDLDTCGNDPSWICRTVEDATGSETLANTAEFLATRPLRIAMIIIGAILVRRFLHLAIDRLTKQLRDGKPRLDKLPAARHLRFYDEVFPEPDLRAEQRAQTISALLKSVSSLVIWTITVLLVLGELGVVLGPLLAGAGIAGVAFGFGAQSLVKDFLSGVFMLMEDQYGVGDVVDVGEAVGVVEEVSLRTTRLRSLDGTVWHVPNGEISRVGNLTQQWSRVVLDVGVAYASDLRTTRQIVEQAAARVADGDQFGPDIVEPPTVLGVEGLDADQVTLRLLAKTKPGAQWDVGRALREEIKGALDEAGIEIPFPQRTVWMRPDTADSSVTVATGDAAVPVPTGSEPRGSGNGAASEGARQPREGGRDVTFGNDDERDDDEGTDGEH